MELEAAKVIGAGLAVIGVIGSGIGLGTVFGKTHATHHAPRTTHHAPEVTPPRGPHTSHRDRGMRSRGGRDPCPWRESVTASSRASRAVSVGALLPGAPAAGAQLELAVVVEGLEPFEVREPIDSCERDSCIDGAASEGGAHETASAPSYTSPSALVWRPCRRAHAAARSMRPFVAVRAWRLRRPAHPSVPAARSPDRYRATVQPGH